MVNSLQKNSFNSPFGVGSLGAFNQSQPKFKIDPETGLPPIDDPASFSDEVNSARKTVLQEMVDQDMDKRFDGFMKMFLATLKHQNPDNPPDAMEMSANIMTFLQAGELSKSNHLLGKMTNTQDTELVLKAKSFVNKEVEFVSNTIDFKGIPEAIAFTLPTGVQEAVLSITDKNGNIVAKFDADKSTKAQKIVWDGKTNGGEDAPIGSYNLTLMAKDGLGNTGTLPIRLTGVITGYTPLKNGEIVYQIGEKDIYIKDIEKIGGDQNNELLRQHSQTLHDQINELKGIKAQMENLSSLYEGSMRKD